MYEDVNSRLLQLVQQAKESAAKAERERKAQYYHDEAVKAAIERRKQFYQD